MLSVDNYHLDTTYDYFTQSRSDLANVYAASWYQAQAWHQNISPAYCLLAPVDARPMACATIYLGETDTNNNVSIPTTKIKGLSYFGVAYVPASESTGNHWAIYSLDQPHGVPAELSLAPFASYTGKVYKYDDGAGNHPAYTARFNSFGKTEFVQGFDLTYYAEQAIVLPHLNYRTFPKFLSNAEQYLVIYIQRYGSNVENNDDGYAVIEHTDRQNWSTTVDHEDLVFFKSINYDSAFSPPQRINYSPLPETAVTGYQPILVHLSANTGSVARKMYVAIRTQGALTDLVDITQQASPHTAETGTTPTPLLSDLPASDNLSGDTNWAAMFAAKNIVSLPLEKPIDTIPPDTTPPVSSPPGSSSGNKIKLGIGNFSMLLLLLLSVIAVARNIAKMQLPERPSV